MLLESSDYDKVIEHLKSYYPNIEIKEIIQDTKSDISLYYNKKQFFLDLLPIIISFIIFIFGIIFKRNLHNTYFSIGEYIVFGIAYFLSG